MPPRGSGNAKRGGRKDNGVGIVVGKHFPTSRFGTVIARYPTLTFFIAAFPYIILLIVLLIGADPEVDTAEGSFRPISHVSAIQYNRAEELESQWFAKTNLGNSDTIGLRASGSLTYRSKPSERIEIRYSVSGQRLATSILAQGPMQAIRDFEQTVLNAASVREVCLNNNGWGQHYVTRDATGCVPMVSLTTFVFPGNATAFSTAGYPFLPNDGAGGEYQVPSPRLISRIINNPNYRWFLDATFTPTSPESTNSRAHLILGSPISISGGVSTSIAGATYTRKKYMSAARAVADIIDAANRNQNDVVFSMTSDLLDEAIATDAASTSLLLLCAAVVVVGIVVFIRTGSIFLGIIGVVFNILAFMANMAIFSGLSGGTLPLLALAAVFLLVSLNVQNLLLTVDTFRHSGMMASSGRDNDLSLSQRISYCIRHAGGASFTIQILMVIMFALIATLDVAALRSVALFCLLMMVWIIYNTFIFHNAVVGFYHVQFAGNGRLRQRQINARRRREAEGGSMLRRNKALKAVLQTLEEHPLPGEVCYSTMREQVESQKARRKNVTGTKSFRKVLAGIRDDTISHLVTLAKPTQSKKKANKEEALREERLRARAGRSGALEEGSYSGFNANPQDPTGAFEMSEFAEAGEVHRAHGFISSRMVPTISILHLSVGTLRRAPQEYSDGSDASDVGGDASAPGGRIPMSQVEAGVFESAISEADAHVIALMGEAEVVASGSSNSSSSTSSNAPREFSDNETDNPLQEHSALFQPQGGSPVRVNIASNLPPTEEVLSNGSMGGSVRILSPLNANSTTHSKLNTDTARFIAKWSFVGNTLICGRTPTNTTWEVSSPAMPFVAAMLSNTILGDNVEGFGTVLIPKEVREKLKKRTPLSDEAKASKKKRVKWFAKLKRRWKDRSDEPQRRWFCCGRRVGETRDEKDSRLMEKVAKPPKYTPGERFVRGPLMKGLKLLKIPLMFLCLALLGAFCYFASELTSLKYTRMDLVEGSLREQFDQAGALQAYPTAPCDYCSNYYSKPDAFRGTLESEYGTCAPQFGWQQQNLYVDTCGKCMGEEECHRCDGVSYDSSAARYALVEDSCGLCRVPTTSSEGTTIPPCGECVYATSTCSQCQVDGRTSSFAGGPTCAVTCPSGCANCNPYTGTCVSLATSTQCLGKGLIDSGSSFSATNCSCYGAWTGNMCQFCGCRNGGQCHPTTGVCQCPSAYAGARCESCSVGCSVGGVCQRNWTIGELLLPSCVALECPASDIQSGTICSACSSKLLPVVLGATSAASCWALGVGAWDGSQCRAFQYSTGPTTCSSSCRGYWSGSNCSTCSVPGGHCLPDGSVVACDKRIYTKNVTSTDSVPSTKNCNTCGIDVTCAVAVLNPQPNAIEIPFRIFISVSRSIDDPAAETQIRSFVNDIVLAVQYPGGPVAASISALFPTALVDFYSSREYADNSTVSTLLSVRLNNFLTNNARLPEIGLTSYNNWYIVMSGTVSCPLPCTSSDIANRMGKFERGLSNVARSQTYLTISLQSAAWMDAVVGEYLEEVLIKLSILGIVIFTCVLLGTTASLKLTAFGLVTMGCTVTGTLSVLTWLSHPISPASTIAYAIVMCIPAQYSIHLTLQYVDKLEGETLSIFSEGSTAYFAMKQALTRTVPSMVTCTVATLAVGVVLLLSELVPVRELAMCIMVATSMALFFTVLFLPPLILLLGPTITRRHKIFILVFITIGLVASIVILLI